MSFINRTRWLLPARYHASRLAHASIHDESLDTSLGTLHERYSYQMPLLMIHWQWHYQPVTLISLQLSLSRHLPASATGTPTSTALMLLWAIIIIHIIWHGNQLIMRIYEMRQQPPIIHARYILLIAIFAPVPAREREPFQPCQISCAARPIRLRSTRHTAPPKWFAFSLSHPAAKSAPRLAYLKARQGEMLRLIIDWMIMPLMRALNRLRLKLKSMPYSYRQSIFNKTSPYVVEMSR